MTGEAARHVGTVPVAGSAGAQAPARAPGAGGAGAAAAPPGEVSLAGWTWSLGDEGSSGSVGGRDSLRDAMDKAFDFRGDVVLTLADGRTIGGYVFDRRAGDNPCVRLLCPGSDQKIEVAYAQVRRVEFADKDPAAGKSFETWVKKYAEKKRAGLAANIESESLE